MDDGDLVIIARMGWFFDTRSSAYRTIYATAQRGHFTIGELFEVSLPTYANLQFSTTGIRITTSSFVRTGRHIDYRETAVTVHANGADLAATITEPLGAGLHPGIAIVHGAERGERYLYDIWVGLYASQGIAVITYDKRGVGSSTGTYPGELPSQAALETYAEDASAVRDFLARWPGVDGASVGFHGGSQGGWTVPLAMQRHPGAAFAVLASAPATTVDQADLWASFTGGGVSAPEAPTEEMLEQVRAIHSGYDPAPALQSLRVPALWLLGVNDRTVPTAICVEILDGMHRSNFSVALLPTGHALLVNQTGLLAGDAQSPGLAPELLPTLDSWLERVAAG